MYAHKLHITVEVGFYATDKFISIQKNFIN